eukprot:9916193-Prorocentrum_lima.AAC.1
MCIRDRSEEYPDGFGIAIYKLMTEHKDMFIRQAQALNSAGKVHWQRRMAHTLGCRRVPSEDLLYIYLFT